MCRGWLRFALLLAISGCNRSDADLPVPYEPTRNACNPDLLAAIARADEPAVRDLLARGATGRCADTWRRLHWAVTGSNLTQVRLLLEAGADPNHHPAGATHVTTVFSEATRNRLDRNGSLDMVRLLLQHGANPNVFAADRTTPLMSAAAKGDTALVSLLLDQGADASATAGATRKTALDYASEAGHQDIVDLLRRSQ